MTRRILLAAFFCSAASTLGQEAGQTMERTACVACHSLRIVKSQRLSAAAWEKEVDKMVGWGAVVPERKVLIDYLATEYSNAKPAPAPEISKSGVSH